MAIRTQCTEGQFSWVELKTEDYQDACEFYGRLFGWESQPADSDDGPQIGQFLWQKYFLAGIRATDHQETQERGPAIWRSHLQVADLAETLERVAKLGGVVTSPAQQLADFGTLAMVQDPSGAELGLWQPRQPFGEQLVQDIHAFCWNELCTRDTAAARKFFSELFHWSFVEHPLPGAEYHMIENQGEQNGGMLRLDQRWGSLPPRWLVYFAVTSVDFSVDQVRQLGGNVFVPPCDIPEGRMAIVVDRQGAMFSLVQMDDEEE